MLNLDPEGGLQIAFAIFVSSVQWGLVQATIAVDCPGSDLTVLLAGQTNSVASETESYIRY